MQVTLIADDHSDTGELTRALRGHTLQFGSPAGGLYLLGQELPDCLILWLTPVQLGPLEVLPALKETFEGHLPCPVLVVAREGDERLARRAFNLGAHDYLPWAPEATAELEEAMREAHRAFSAERVLRERSELLTYLNRDIQRRDRLKTRFVANASHELRTPVSAMVGVVSMLRSGNRDPVQASGLLDTLAACCDSLLSVLDDLLDLTGMDTGRIEVRQEPFEPAGIARQVMNSWAPVAENKGVKLQSQVEANLPSLVLGDPRRLRQVLFSLVGNGLKFLASGTVELRIHSLLRDGLDPEKATALRFEVDIQGEGAAASRVALEADAFSEHPAQGQDYVDISVALARTLVRAMDSKLELGAGGHDGLNCAFEVVCPVVTPAPRSEPAAATGGSRNILVAEDNPIVAHIITLQLRQLGYQVTVVQDGIQVLETLAQQPFDAVIMDCQMPRLDGLEATRRLRQAYTAETLPIIALTANAQPGQAEQCLAAGMNEYLVKPAPADVLKAVLEKHFAPT